MNGGNKGKIAFLGIKSTTLRSLLVENRDRIRHDRKVNPSVDVVILVFIVVFVKENRPHNGEPNHGLCGFLQRLTVADQECNQE